MLKDKASPCWNTNQVDEPLLDRDEDVPLILTSGEETGRSEGFWSRFGAKLIYPFRLAYNNGTICAVFSQFLYAFLGILFKMISKRGIPSFEILFIRSAFTASTCFIALKILRYPRIFGPRDCWGLLAIRVVTGSIGMGFSYISFCYMPVGDAVALSRLAPVYSVLFACLLRWEVLTLPMAFGALVSSVGGVFIVRPPVLFGGTEHWDATYVLGFCLAFSSAIFISLAYLTVGRMGTKVGEFTVAFSGHLFCAIILPLPIALSFPSAPVFKFTWEDGALFLMFLPMIVCANVLTTRAVQLCDGVQGTSIQTVGIPFSYLLGLFFLEEKVTMYAIIGTIVVGIGIWGVAIGKAKARRIQMDCDSEKQEQQY